MDRIVRFIALSSFFDEGDQSTLYWFETLLKKTKHVASHPSLGLSYKTESEWKYGVTNPKDLKNL
jgi:hypothetical protein